MLPLVSAHAAGILKPFPFMPSCPELIPLSEALPRMGIALCCVWAAYTISELPQWMASAAAPPEVAAHAAEPPQAVVLASALVGGGAQQCTLSLSCYIQRDGH